MELENKIRMGGEFEIDPQLLSGYADYVPKESIFLYSSGRSALMGILLHIFKSGIKTIHIPYYSCFSVVNACENSGFRVKFYELTEDFLMPMDYLSKIGYKESLMTVNYFGFVDDNPSLVNIKILRPDIITISDQVQSLWTCNNTVADFSFVSLRKHFSIPGGAFIYSKNKSINHDDQIPHSSFYKNKLIGSILKHKRLPDNVYLKFFEAGENELNNEKRPSRAPDLINFLYESLDLEWIKKRRKENNKFVYEYGLMNNFDFVFPYNETAIPLNVPIFLKNRDKVRKKMMAHNIFLPVHYPLGDFNRSSIFAKKMSESELSLVIDQRYSVNEIEIELETINKTINHG